MTIPDRVEFTIDGEMYVGVRKDWYYDPDDKGWCRACYGSFDENQMLGFRGNSPDMGPICESCVVCLASELMHRGHR